MKLGWGRGIAGQFTTGWLEIDSHFVGRREKINFTSLGHLFQQRRSGYLLFTAGKLYQHPISNHSSNTYYTTITTFTFTYSSDLSHCTHYLLSCLGIYTQATRMLTQHSSHTHACIDWYYQLLNSTQVFINLIIMIIQLGFEEALANCFELDHRQ